MSTTKKTTTTTKARAGREAARAAKESREDLRPVEGAAADAELAGLARAVSNASRVTILRRLSRGMDCCGADLVDELALAQPTVSQHVQVLRDAGLVCDKADGRRKCYCIDGARLRRFKALVASL
jgi:ArsR family transcriptional regulator